MYEFAYQRASSPSEAVELLTQAEEGSFLAGGMTLIPTLKLRLASPSNLIDLGGLAELRGIKQEGNAIVIGAMTTHAEVACA